MGFQEWKDYKLKWNPDEYNGVREICLPSSDLWNPDVLLYNRLSGSVNHNYMKPPASLLDAVFTCSADEDIDSKYPTNIVVKYDGNISWIPLGLFISSCSIDITVRHEWIYHNKLKILNIIVIVRVMPLAVVSVRRPNLQDEVRELELRQGRHQPDQIVGRNWHQWLLSVRRVEAHWSDAQPN